MDDSSPNADGSPQASERSSGFDDDMDLDSDSEEREEAALSLERRSVSPEFMEASTPYLSNAVDKNDNDQVPFEKHTHDTGDDDGKLETFHMHTGFFSKWLTLEELVCPDHPRPFAVEGDVIVRHLNGSDDRLRKAPMNEAIRYMDILLGGICLPHMEPKGYRPLGDLYNIVRAEVTGVEPSTTCFIIARVYAEPLIAKEALERLTRFPLSSLNENAVDDLLVRPGRILGVLYRALPAIATQIVPLCSLNKTSFKHAITVPDLSDCRKKNLEELALGPVSSWMSRQEEGGIFQEQVTPVRLLTTSWSGFPSLTHRLSL